MSSSIKTIAPLAGAAVGFVGSGFNPAGAMAGYQLGSMAGGAIGGEDKGQSSTVPGLPQMPQAGVISPQAQTQGANPLGGFAPRDVADNQAPGVGGKGALLNQGLMMAGQLQNAKTGNETREALLSKNQAEIEALNRQSRPFVSPGQIPFAGGQFKFGR